MRAIDLSQPINQSVSSTQHQHQAKGVPSFQHEKSQHMMAPAYISAQAKESTETHTLVQIDSSSIQLTGSSIHQQHTPAPVYTRISIQLTSSSIHTSTSHSGTHQTELALFAMLRQLFWIVEVCATTGHALLIQQLTTQHSSTLSPQSRQHTTGRSMYPRLIGVVVLVLVLEQQCWRNSAGRVHW